MGDDPKTGIKTDMSPGVAKWMKALSGAGKLDKEQSQKFLDLVMGGYDPADGSFSITGKALPVHAVRVHLPEEEEETKDIFEIEYQTKGESVKISGTLDEIRAKLAKGEF